MRGLGMNMFLEPCDANVDSTAYFSPTATYKALVKVAEDTVTALLYGGGVIELCGESLRSIPNTPGVAAVFGSHEETARLVAQTVLATLIDQQKRKSPRQSAYTLAQVLIQEIIDTLSHGGDPAACQMEFETTFRSWSALSNLSVPTSVSKTGWCEKDLALPVSPNGRIASCKATAICRMELQPNGTVKIYETPPPPPGDPGVVVSAPGTEPAAPPTKEQIEAEIRRKMALPGGGSLAEQEAKAELAELAGYLKALKEARLYLTMALGIPVNATDAVLGRALAHEGIAPREVLDWFDGCSFDTHCFREQMNIAIGEARRYAKDTRAKIAVAALAIGALGYLLLGPGRR
jgi:hypothetical protein